MAYFNSNQRSQIPNKLIPTTPVNTQNNNESNEFEGIWKKNHKLKNDIVVSEIYEH